MTSFILTILGPDRPGLVETLASIVEAHGGNWLESRMAKLSGHFAGILRIEAPAENRNALEQELSALTSQSLQISIAIEDQQLKITGPSMSLEIIGHDQPGIVKRITSTLAAHGANVEELETSLESAPMAGHELFRTQGTVRIPESHDPGELITALEELGPDLSVTITS